MKLTQEQVAAKLQLMGPDMSRGTYSQIECGLKQHSSRVDSCTVCDI
ncbi:MAG: hypothetical protein MJ067_04005 [Oscillospiraceae bacterium]|nr:hypothetical protein [Oscillospiraceae bacterium]